jgi:hypothetical protein
VVVTSDFLGGGTGGDITLQNGGQIDVSGGTGATGGSAQQNGGDPGLDVDPPTNLAVVFDANNGLGASAGANPGKVLNFGTISANGGSGSIVGLGGDVYFNGLNSAGSAVTFTDGGTQSRTGSVAGGFWTH